MKDICLLLLKAKSEEEVTSVIQSNPNFFAPKNWQPFPDGSYGTIESQGRDPHRALVEKLTNAIDAILLRECSRLGIGPESEEAPNSINKAVEKFFEIDSGDITGISKDKMDRLASQIYLIAENLNNKKGNIYILDKGEGQAPEKFKETFLKFGGNKVKIFFVHGRFGTGSFGVLPNSGDNGYQLIISKKYLPNDNSGEWGWTLIRKRMPEDIYTKSAWYEYITLEGKIPTFAGDDLSEIIRKTIGYSLLDIKDYKHGTIVKLYDYDLVTTSNIDRDLSRILDKFLFAPALPYRVLDAQTKSHVGAGKEQFGNLNRLKKNNNELEGGNKLTIQKAKLGILGVVDIDIYVSKKRGDGKKSFIDSEAISTSKESVFFIRNGQSHGEFDRSFLKNDVGLSYIANDMSVYIDCTNTIPTHFDRVFPPTRDILRNNRYQEEVKANLEYELKNDEGLKQLNMIRKNQIITEEVKKSEDLESFVNDLMEFDPTLKMLIEGAFEISLRGQRGISEKTFEGKKYPTYLKVKDTEINNTGFKNIPINSYVNVVLETDAENNYLIRDENPGGINVSFDGEARSIKLRNGRLTIRLFPTKNSKVGGEGKVLVELTRPFTDSLKADFMYRVTDPIIKETNIAIPPPPPAGKKLNLPQLHSLTEKEWEEAGYDKNNLTELEIEKNLEKSIYLLKAVSVNSDFPFLKIYFQNQRYSNRQIEIMRKQFVNAVYIATLSVHRNFAKENSYPTEKASEIINNVGYVLPYSLFTMQKKVLKELEER
ncbi:MAG: hypothetical protein HYT08_00700 [Candidatus Levybacteria bacterium]|nr:hypothetical protein [Candidatus Levybacteria bacterium]